MKVSITTFGTSLEDDLDPVFSRCLNFIIVDTETNAIEAYKNEWMSAFHDAGIATAQKMVDLNVKAVITGNIGPNAFAALKKAGILIYTGAKGKAKDMLRGFKEGNLPELRAPTVGLHGDVNGTGLGAITGEP